jgi:flavin reductase (DIM6/NTAB) family NADH-FMN oxidoreductase RutF
MEKINMGSNVYIPMLVTLLGVNVEDRPNFMALGWISRLNASPPLLGAAINKFHYSAEGIRENETFSINIPSKEMMKETDYCGLTSGRESDKSKIFKVFYGELETAPMIEQCPLCIECKLIDIHPLPSNDLIIGEIVESYTERRYLSNDALDAQKIDPLFLTMPDNNYWTLGDNVGKAWEVGKDMKAEKDRTDYIK